jgi:hypothetical protein
MTPKKRRKTSPIHPLNKKRTNAGPGQLWKLKKKSFQDTQIQWDGKVNIKKQGMAMMDDEYE